MKTKRVRPRRARKISKAVTRRASQKVKPAPNTTNVATSTPLFEISVSAKRPATTDKRVRSVKRLSINA